MSMFKDLWEKVVPFPPGWFRMREASQAVRQGNYPLAIERAELALMENEAWKKEGLASHPWRIIVDDNRSVDINPLQLLKALHHDSD